jgi:hypothetical protein
VEKIPWQSNTGRPFFIDNDEDPFNDSMVLFEKTSNNKFELSRILCFPPALNSTMRTLSQTDKPPINLVIKKGKTPVQLSTVASGFEGECFVEPLDISSHDL